MFSYADLVRVEIAMEVEKQFDVTTDDEAIVTWRTLGDVARAVVGHPGNTAIESEVFDWIRTLIAQGYGISTELLPEDPVLCDYDRMISWFSAAPYPHRLGDRWFARSTDGHADATAESHSKPDPAG